VSGREQLALALPARPALGRAEFFVADANRLALARSSAGRIGPAGGWR
jgi:hypothetical protein